MSSISYEHADGDDHVTKLVVTDAQTAESYGSIPYRHAVLSLEDAVLLNDGVDTETIGVEIVDGLEVARGTAPEDAAVLSEDATATLSIDGATVDVSLTGGSGTKTLTTTKSDGATIEVELVALSTGPVDGDRATIEVTA